jgi:hypothetical protein
MPRNSRALLPARIRTRREPRSAGTDALLGFLSSSGLSPHSTGPVHGSLPPRTGALRPPRKPKSGRERARSRNSVSAPSRRCPPISEKIRKLTQRGVEAGSSSSTPAHRCPPTPEGDVEPTCESIEGDFPVPPPAAVVEPVPRKGFDWHRKASRPCLRTHPRAPCRPVSEETDRRALEGCEAGSPVPSPAHRLPSASEEADGGCSKAPRPIPRSPVSRAVARHSPKKATNRRASIGGRFLGPYPQDPCPTASEEVEGPGPESISDTQVGCPLRGGRPFRGLSPGPVLGLSRRQ